MSHVAVAVATGLGAATAYGVASAVQHDQVGRLAAPGGFDPSLLTRLARRPLWLVGMGADVLAVALQAVALRFGPVALIQLLVVGGLPIAVVLSASFARARLTRRQVGGLVLCTAGLACAVPASTAVGLGHPAGRIAWVSAVGLAMVVIALLLIFASTRPGSAGPLQGVAAGIAAGTSSVLLAVCAARFGNLPGLLASPAPYAAAVSGLAALLLTQQAFQTGSLGAPLAALSVAEPAVAVVLAVSVLHQQLPSGAAVLAAGTLGVAAAVAGVLLLSAAPREPAVRASVSR
ncbi:MAG: hypothetical protein NVS3B26_29660 [Mycobacteriales bacterium]